MSVALVWPPTAAEGCVYTSTSQIEGLIGLHVARYKHRAIVQRQTRRPPHFGDRTYKTCNPRCDCSERSADCPIPERERAACKSTYEAQFFPSLQSVDWRRGSGLYGSARHHFNNLEENATGGHCAATTSKLSQSSRSTLHSTSYCTISGRAVQ